MRPLVLMAALAIVATACSSGVVTPAASPGSTAANPSDRGPAPADAPPCTPVADLGGSDFVEAERAANILAADLSDPLVLEGFDPSRIRTLLRPDAIRPIDEPCFDTVHVASGWLTDQSPVVYIEVHGDRRAYPLGIMTQHEIANDVVGGEPVIVTYCPLCNSGLAFFRTLNGEVHSFGTSGRLFQTNLVMWDRQTGTLWSQFTGEALVGPFVGTTLERITTSLLSFGEFAELAPDGLVLSPQVDDRRDYTRNAYVGYDDSAIERGIFEGDTDDGLPANARVAGLGAQEGDPIAVTIDVLREDPTHEVDVAGTKAVILWAPGAASALDTEQIDGGREVGQTGAFDRTAPDGILLDFTVAADDPSEFVSEDGTRWNIIGEAISGPRAGERLTALQVDDTFWFVWFAFQPGTRVVGGGA